MELLEEMKYILKKQELILNKEVNKITIIK
jgi:hypothetical protein